MNDKSYNIVKVKYNVEVFNTLSFWNKVEPIIIDNYLWMENNYKPRVEAELCYSADYLFSHFKVYEKEITATYTKFNDPVHKDSCVEFFVNLFPNETDKYFNFEVNPIGTMHVGFGILGNRRSIETSEIKINSTYKKPFSGIHGREYWEVFFKTPIALFEKHYKLKFKANKAKGNFYKCGDETKYEHYGVWNNIFSEKPNFHLPNYFGNLVFI
jgi:Carbohydrate-binding family 9